MTTGPQREQPLHTERRGRGPWVVLVHGFTQTGRSWRHVAGGLTDALVGGAAGGHEVVAVDAPGHGGSAAVAVDLTSGATLLGRAGGPGAYIGYSMGGRLALHLALAQPDLVTGLVLLGAHPGLEDEVERTARRAADEALATRLEDEGVDRFLDAWLAQPLFAGLPRDQADLDDRRRNRASALATSLRLTGTGTQAPLWDRLAGLEMPVLVLAGERDEKFSALGRRMAAAIGANAGFTPVPGAGHAAHLEQPEAFLAIVQAWLSQHHL